MTGKQVLSTSDSSVRSCCIVHAALVALLYPKSWELLNLKVDGCCHGASSSTNGAASIQFTQQSVDEEKFRFCWWFCPVVIIDAFELLSVLWHCSVSCMVSGLYKSLIISKISLFGTRSGSGKEGRLSRTESSSTRLSLTMSNLQAWQSVFESGVPS